MALGVSLEYDRHTTYVVQVMNENPTSMTVPPIQPAYENARGMESRPMPTKTAIALKSCLLVMFE